MFWCEDFRLFVCMCIIEECVWESLMFGLCIRLEGECVFSSYLWLWWFFELGFIVCILIRGYLFRVLELVWFLYSCVVGKFMKFVWLFLFLGLGVWWEGRGFEVVLLKVFKLGLFVIWLLKEGYLVGVELRRWCSFF